MFTNRFKLMHGLMVVSLFISMSSSASPHYEEIVASYRSVNLDEKVQSSVAEKLCTNAMHDNIQRTQASDAWDDVSSKKNVSTVKHDDTREPFDHFGALSTKEQTVLLSVIPYFEDAIEYEYSLPKMHHDEMLQQLTIRPWIATLKKPRS